MSGDWSPSARQAIGIWAYRPNYPRHSTELPNPTTYFPLTFGSNTGDEKKICSTLNSSIILDHVIWDSGPHICTSISCRVDGAASNKWFRTQSNLPLLSFFLFVHRFNGSSPICSMTCQGNVPAHVLDGCPIYYSTFHRANGPGLYVR